MRRKQTTKSKPQGLELELGSGGESHLRELLEELPQPICCFLPDGTIRFANAAFARFLGQRESTLLGRDFFEVMANGRRPDWRELIRELDRDHPVVTLEHSSSPTNGGGRRWVECRHRAVFESEGKLVEIQTVGLSLFLDLTQVKRAEKQRRLLERQVQRSQKLESLGILAGGIAHDFNNLLTGILGNVSLALMKLPPGAGSRKPIEKIEAAAVRAAELTNQMLAYSGKGKFLVEALDLSEIVREMGQLLEASISTKSKVHFDLSPCLPKIEADAAQIRQVVLNLITNASEAALEEPGTVDVKTDVVEADASTFSDAQYAGSLAEGCYVTMEVTDRGVGMDEETLVRIFDPFFTTKFTGRGLGLAAVLGIVRGHDGAIRVESKPGQGTVIRVFFPASDRNDATDALQAKDSHRGVRQGIILIVDDESEVREVARLSLEQVGYRILTAADGPAALELLREHGAEILGVVLDLSMPRMSGEETFEEIRRRHADVPVVLMSGYGEQEATHLVTEDALAAFLQKPFRPPELIAKLGDILG